MKKIQNEETEIQNEEAGINNEEAKRIKKVYLKMCADYEKYNVQLFKKNKKYYYHHHPNNVKIFDNFKKYYYSDDNTLYRDEEDYKNNYMKYDEIDMMACDYCYIKNNYSRVIGSYIKNYCCDFHNYKKK